MHVRRDRRSSGLHWPVPPLWSSRPCLGMHRPRPRMIRRTSSTRPERSSRPKRSLRTSREPLCTATTFRRLPTSPTGFPAPDIRVSRARAWAGRSAMRHAPITTALPAADRRSGPTRYRVRPTSTTPFGVPVLHATTGHGFPTHSISSRRGPLLTPIICTTNTVAGDLGPSLSHAPPSSESPTGGWSTPIGSIR